MTFYAKYIPHGYWGLYCNMQGVSRWSRGVDKSKERAIEYIDNQLNIYLLKYIYLKEC